MKIDDLLLSVAIIAGYEALFIAELTVTAGVYSVLYDSSSVICVGGD